MFRVSSEKSVNFNLIALESGVSGKLPQHKRRLPPTALTAAASNRSDEIMKTADEIMKTDAMKLWKLYQIIKLSTGTSCRKIASHSFDERSFKQTTDRNIIINKGFNQQPKQARALQPAQMMKAYESWREIIPFSLTTIMGRDVRG